MIIEPVVFGETFDRATASAVFDGTTIELEDAVLVQRQSSFGGHLTMDLGQKRPPRLSYSACSGPGGSRFANWANGLNGLRASWVD